MRKTFYTLFLLSCTTFVAQAGPGGPDENNQEECQPQYFNCPDGYELDIGICGCVKVLPVKCPPGAANKCPLNQVFDEAACACVCKSESCQGKQVFNPDKCACECPAEAASRCGRDKVLDPDTCECVCADVKRCNRLQGFNKDTCECECQKVIIAPRGRRRRPICKPGSSRSDSSDDDGDSDSDSDSSNGCSEDSDSSDSSDSNGGGGHGRGGRNYYRNGYYGYRRRYYGNNGNGGSRSKRSGGSDSSSGGRKRIQPLRPIIANECPRGQRANKRTCRCHYRRRY